MIRQAARLGLSVAMASALVSVWERMGFGVGAVVTLAALLVLDLVANEIYWHRWTK